MDFTGEFGLAAQVIEKDYVLGWVLAGIFNHPVIGSSWVFKGGTCLKKCFFETYRFFEDLDFTLSELITWTRNFSYHVSKKSHNGSIMRQALRSHRISSALMCIKTTEVACLPRDGLDIVAPCSPGETFPASSLI